MSSITPVSATDFSTFDAGNYQAMDGIATSENGTIMYVAMNGSANAGVVKSADSGATWNVVNSASYTSIACSSDGNIVYAASLGIGLFKSVNAGVTWNQVTFLPDLTLPGGASNPESPAGGAFPGYTLENTYQIACDATGSKLIMTTNAAASIYGSTDGGVTWSFLYVAPVYPTNPVAPTMITSNADGTVLYAALNNATVKNIVVSKDSGATWASINMMGVSGPFQTLSTNSFGDFVFAVDGTSRLNIFYPTHADKALLVPSSGNTLVSMAAYNSGNSVVIAQNSYDTIINGAVVLYSLVNKYEAGQPSVPCFKKGSHILCFKEGKEVYVKVEDIRRGDQVKTVRHGYVGVEMIGTTKMYHSSSSSRAPNRLYVCTREKYPELEEDLVITGCHSILVGALTKEQRAGTMEMLGRVMVTDGMYRLMAFLDERAELYGEEGVFSIWHLALEHEDYYMNYGVYANGLVVETCSKRYLKELSGMTLL